MSSEQQRIRELLHTEVFPEIEQSRFDAFFTPWFLLYSSLAKLKSGDVISMSETFARAHTGLNDLLKALAVDETNADDSQTNAILFAGIQHLKPGKSMSLVGREIWVENELDNICKTLTKLQPMFAALIQDYDVKSTGAVTAKEDFFIRYTVCRLKEHFELSENESLSTGKRSKLHRMLTLLPQWSHLKPNTLSKQLERIKHGRTKSRR